MSTRQKIYLHKPRKLNLFSWMLVALLLTIHSSLVFAYEPKEICDNLYNSGQYEAAATCYLSLTPPDYGMAGASYYWLGYIAYQQGNYAAAVNYYLLEAQYYSLTTDIQRTGIAYYHVGQAAYALGDLEDAKNYYLQAANYFVQASDYWWASGSYGWAGNIAYEQGDYEAALNYYLLEIQYAELSGDSLRKGYAYYHAGQTSYALGNLEDAKNYYLQAADNYVQVPDYGMAGASYYWLGYIAYEQGDYAAAVNYYLLEAQYYSLTTDIQRTGIAYYHVGQAAYALGDLEDAKNYYLQAASYFVQASDYWWAGDSYSWAGNIANEQEEYDAAISYYLLSAENFVKVSDYRRTGDSYAGAGNAAEAKGDCANAIIYWRKAKEFYDLAGYEYTIPCCSAAKPKIEEIRGLLPCGGGSPIGRMEVEWGHFGRREVLEANSQEKLEVECVNGKHYGLYYTSRQGSRSLIGMCPFEGGCNLKWFFHSGDNDSDGSPDCFLSTFWRSMDYGYCNDCLGCTPDPHCVEILRNPWTGEVQEDPERLDWAETEAILYPDNLAITWITTQFEYARYHYIDCRNPFPLPEGTFVLSQNLPSKPPAWPEGMASFSMTGTPVQTAPTSGAPSEDCPLKICDLNGDGNCDQLDYGDFQVYVGTCTDDPAYHPKPDIDRNGCVDLMDQYFLFPDIDASPTSFNFANVLVGKTSAPQTLTISNASGGQDLILGTISLTGEDAADFVIATDNCSGLTLAPSKSCTVDVAFSPKSAGSKVANVAIPSNDPDTPTFVISLNGEGITPTLITLSSFTATPANGEITLEWSTESEIDNAGFNLYRAESEDGEYVKINASLIPAEGNGTSGATYQYVDSNVKNRTTYYYKLEDIDLNGNSTIHGPVSATPRRINVNR